MPILHFTFQGYLLASHLARTDLVDVHAFCRQQGLLHLGRSEPVRSLVLWREVFPASCNRGLSEPVVPYTPTTTSPYQPPQGRWFLLIVGKVTKLCYVVLQIKLFLVPLLNTKVLTHYSL